jgi:cytochrome c oxidase cbb3-type subunit 3
VKEVASYVLSLSGRKVDLVEAKKRGSTVCHVRRLPRSGCRGRHRLRRTDLTNNIWLGGGSRQVVEQTITHGAWRDAGLKDILGKTRYICSPPTFTALSHNDRQNQQ